VSPRIRIGCSGHRSLAAHTTELVGQALDEYLAAYSDAGFVGISALADGADQLFARAVLSQGGGLHVIVPSNQYRDGLPASTHDAYDALLSQAESVETLPFQESTEEAHMAAGQAMLSECDRLVAVWDGLPARGYGGTADVVALARGLGLPVDVIWPAGASRE